MTPLECLKFIRPWLDEKAIFNVRQMKTVGDLVNEVIASNEWISVKDKLPRDGQYVLTYPVYTSSVFSDEPRHVLRYKNGRFIHYLGGSIHTTYELDITHWMPLPAPSTEDSSVD